MLTNLKDYLNETLSSRQLESDIYLIVKDMIKGKGDTENAIKQSARVLSKLHHARTQDIEEKIKKEIKRQKGEK